MKEAVPTTPELKRIDEKVTLYEHGDFRICVIETDDMFEAWLAHKDYGSALHLFGCAKAQPARPEKPLSLDEFLKIVANSLERYEWICSGEIEDLDI